MKTKPRESLLHPLGEGELDFKFLPAGGQFHLRGSDEALTAYGGLVAWDHFLERCGVFAQLAGDYPLPRTSPNATPVIDILKAFSLNCLVGGTRFAHCRRLQDDTAVANISGMHKGRLCGEDAFRRLCGSLDAAQLEEWFAPAEQMIHHAMPPNAVADWDSTVVVRYGKQEDAAIGYNPQKPGRPSHHPLACVIGGTRLCLHMEWRKGNTVSASGWIEAMEKVWRSPLAQHRIRLNRGDIGFGQERPQSARAPRACCCWFTICGACLCGCSKTKAATPKRSEVATTAAHPGQTGAERTAQNPQTGSWEQVRQFPQTGLPKA